MEAVRCMLINAALPNSLLKEAVSTVVYAENCVITRATELVLYEWWTESRVILKDVNPSGRKCSLHVAARKRKKTYSNRERNDFFWVWQWIQSISMLQSNSAQSINQSWRETCARNEKVLLCTKLRHYESDRVGSFRVVNWKQSIIKRRQSFWKKMLPTCCGQKKEKNLFKQGTKWFFLGMTANPKHFDSTIQ